jgi:hypothetical protein
MFRWAQLLKHQMSINVYCLPTKEKKRLFSVGSKQTEVCRFCLLFAENKHKLPFPVSFVFRLRNSGNLETWTWGQGDGDMET